MKVKCGVDIIEISRIKHSIDSLGEAFIKKIYTPKEIEYCESKGKQKYQHYAARFSAKEAIFKAISEKLDNKYELDWTNYEVLQSNEGRPYVNINGVQENNIENIDLSISHCKDYAVASVVMILKEESI